MFAISVERCHSQVVHKHCHPKTYMTSTSVLIYLNSDPPLAHFLYCEPSSLGYLAFPPPIPCEASCLCYLVSFRQNSRSKSLTMYAPGAPTLQSRHSFKLKQYVKQTHMLCCEPAVSCQIVQMYYSAMRLERGIIIISDYLNERYRNSKETSYPFFGQGNYKRERLHISFWLLSLLQALCHILCTLKAVGTNS